MFLLQTTIRSLLLCSLLISSSGIPIVVHLCGGEVESVSVFALSASCEGDDSCEQNGCCNDVVYVPSYHFDATSNIHSIAPLLIPTVNLFGMWSYSYNALDYTTREVICSGNNLYELHSPPELMSMRC